MVVDRERKKVVATSGLCRLGYLHWRKKGREFMRDNGTWSIGLGNWFGVPFRLHVLFIGLAIGCLYIAQFLRELSATHAYQGITWLTVSGLAILYFSVVIHELAHLFVLKWFGAKTEEIVIGPLGGLAPRPNLKDPRREILVHAAGPLANLLMCWLVFAPWLYYLDQALDPLSLANPLDPDRVQLDAPVNMDRAVSLGFWINWCLFLVNLLPADPFDGGPILRALLRYRLPTWDPEKTGIAITNLAKVAGMMLMFVGWYVSDHPASYPFPLWFACVFVGLFVFFGARHEERRIFIDAWERRWVPTTIWTERTPRPAALELASSTQESLPREAEVGRDATDGWGDDVRYPADGPNESLSVVEDDDAKLDEVLARLHQLGRDQLTSQEWRILERASARYRNRR